MSEIPYIDQRAISEPYAASVGRCIEFTIGQVGGIRQAAEMLLGPGSFRIETVTDVGRQMIVLSLPIVKMGNRKFPGIVARIHKYEGGDIGYLIMDDNTRLVDRNNRHPHMSEDGILCHDSNQIVQALRGADYAKAIMYMIEKISTHTPGGEYHTPPGIIICYKDAEAGDDFGSTCDMYRTWNCYHCSRTMCSDHAETCVVCDGRVCESCSSEIYVEGCDRTAGYYRICNGADEDDEPCNCDTSCDKCGVPSGRIEECAGCGESIGHHCIRRCAYHSGHHSPTENRFCSDCVRKDVDTDGYYGCKECCPPDGERCQWRGHTYGRSYPKGFLTQVSIRDFVFLACMDCRSSSRREASRIEDGLNYLDTLTGLGVRFEEGVQSENE